MALGVTSIAAVKRVSETFDQGQILLTVTGTTAQEVNIKVKGHTLGGMDRPGHIKTTKDRQGHTRTIKDHRGHIKTVKVRQGHIVLGMMEIEGHGTPQGTRRPGLPIWLTCMSKGHTIRVLLLTELSLHPRLVKEDVVRNVVSQAATRISTGVYLGIRIKVVTFAEKEDVTRSSIKVKDVGSKAKAHLSHHEVRKTVRGDRESTTGPRHRTRAARHPSPPRRRRDMSDTGLYGN